MATVWTSYINSKFPMNISLILAFTFIIFFKICVAITHCCLVYWCLERTVVWCPKYCIAIPRWKKNLVGSLFCDLHKAFDCVNHDILLAKLELYGISGIANKLMRSYIKNRKHRVVIKDNMINRLTSKWEPVEHGVPQGSVLGPLLFLIYINDLSRTLSSVANPILFADDMSIIISNIDSH